MSTLPVPRLRLLVPEIAPAVVRHHGRIGFVRDTVVEHAAVERSHHDAPRLLADPVAHYEWGEMPRRGTLVDVYG